MADNSILTSTLADIANERGHQRRKWGGDEHDDEVDWQFWHSDIMRRAYMADISFRAGNRAEYRKRMVQIAALAIAAIESFDRQEAIHAT